MKAIILAAGQGTRLKKYTGGLPKGMLMVDGKTIIQRQIDLYRSCGIEDIVIVRGYAADRIQYENVTYYDNKEYESTNMVVSFLCAREAFDDEVILSYSDVLFSEQMLKTMIEVKDDFACAVDVQWQKYWKKRYGKIDFDTESLEINETGDITSLGLSDPPLEQIDARYIGLLKFSVNGLQEILSIWNRDYDTYIDRPWQQSGKCIRQAYMTDLLHGLIGEGKKIKAIPFENGWIEFDTNEDYENVCDWIQDGSIREIIVL